MVIQHTPHIDVLELAVHCAPVNGRKSQSSAFLSHDYELYQPVVRDDSICLSAINGDGNRASGMSFLRPRVELLLYILISKTCTWMGLGITVILCAVQGTAHRAMRHPPSLSDALHGLALGFLLAHAILVTVMALPTYELMRVRSGV